jgi:hypothetical protein
MPREEVARRRQLHAGATAADILFLHRRRVTPRTRGIYLQAASEVDQFAAARRLDLLDQRRRDTTMTRYLNFLFFAGEGSFAARTAVYGFAFQQALNMRDPRELALARASLRGFALASPDRQRDPLPWEACCLVAAWLARRGWPGDLAAGRACIVAFDGYMRPSEVLSIRAIDVTVLRHRTSLPYGRVSVTLAPFVVDCGAPAAPRTKSGDYDDTILFGDASSIAAGRAFAGTALMHAKADAASLSRAFPISLAVFERKFSEASKALNLNRLMCTPHCLRHGGPSTDFALGFRSLSSIQRRGRWHAASSVKRYEKAGRLNKQVAHLTVDLLRQARIDILALPNLL